MTAFSTLSSLSLQPAPVFPELYQELWVYSGSYASINATSAGSAWIKKGATSTESTLDSAGKFFVLNSNWPASQKYSFEATLWSSGTSYTAYAELWDATAGTAVTSSQLSTSSATATVMRSGQFTLTPGHTYGITIWSSGGQVNITDASLIIFPSSPLTSPSVSAISLANPSGNTLKEAYIPLYLWSSGTVQNNSITIGQALLQKGSTTTTSTNGSTTKLITLSSMWSPSQKFAFEASFYTASTGAVYASLWDMTTNSQVASSQISTTSTSSILIRSSSFTLTPNHSYGVAIWSTNQSGDAHISKARLVALSS